MRGIDQRLERLEELLNGSAARIAILKQGGDGAWPAEPPGASLVVAIKNFQYEAGAAALISED